MEIHFDEVDQQAKRIRLNGRLDMKGAGEIDLRFTSLTTTDSSDILVDMNGVDFIASIGMRLLLSCAKAKITRGGRMALFGLQPMVKEALEMAGIDSLIPLFADEPTALVGLKA